MLAREEERPGGTGSNMDAGEGTAAYLSFAFDSRSARRYPGNALARHHEERLAAALILREVVEARGYRTVTEGTILAHHNFAPYQRRVPGLLLPIFPVVGTAGGTSFEFAQFRPDRPRVGKSGKSIKYETAAGGRNAVDCLPTMRRFLADPSVPLMMLRIKTRRQRSSRRWALCRPPNCWSASAPPYWAAS